MSCWSALTTPEIRRRRSGGRNRYNSQRRVLAVVRRMRILELLKRYSVMDRGTQARFARELRVSEATISRDLKALLQSGSICRCCGQLQAARLELKPIRTGRRALGDAL